MKTETIVGIFILIALGIFFYMTFFLGIFRLDRMVYKQYTVNFPTVAGLEKKADVKIAGVKVGWVERIVLEQNRAHADIFVHKNYVVREDAQALVRQDNFLGPKYLEIIPGNPLSAPANPNAILERAGTPPPSLDNILHNMEGIARNIEDITDTMRENFGGTYGKEQMNVLINNVHVAVDRFASLASRLDRTMGDNEEAINTIVANFSDVMQQMRELIPCINKNVNQVSDTIRTDITRVSDKLEGTMCCVEDAALHVCDGFKNVSSICQKLDEGKGLLGKLINEDETYRDIKVSIQGLRKYFTKVDALSIVFDSHGEYMYRPAEHVNFEDAKGYLDIRIHPNDDHFYVLQYVMAQKGNITRTIRQIQWFDENYQEIFPSQTFNVKTRLGFSPELFGNIEIRERVLDQAKIGAQFGKIYRDVALRVGIFENTAGLGIDFNIPLGTDKFRWVTTLEAFDFRGRDRFDDKRPHLKWLNRIFFLRNLYVAFGADDFVSKENANGFFGGGIRFCDDDIKYIVARLGIGGLT